MADEEKDEELEGAPKPSKLPVLLAGINILVSGACLFKILGLPAEPVIVHTTILGEGDGEGDAEEGDGPIHTFEPFLVNLNEAGGGRFLRASVEIEVKNDSALGKLQGKERQVRDEILRYLSNLRVEAALGETNRLRIQDGITARVNEVLDSENAVKRVYFPDFVVQ